MKTTRYKWPDDFSFHHEPTLRVSKAQMLEIAASLHAGEGSEHVAAVLETIRRFHGRETAMATLPRGDHRDRDIATLIALARAMDGLNSNVLARLARHRVDLSTCEPAHVAAMARLAVEDLQRTRPKKKRGKKPLVSHAITFRELAEIYRKATGAEATITSKWEDGQPSGPFFRFMRAAVAPVPELDKLKDQGLATAVKRAIPKSKKQQSIGNSEL